MQLPLDSGNFLPPVAPALAHVSHRDLQLRATAFAGIRADGIVVLLSLSRGAVARSL